jgi:hypothetical protein
MFNLTKEHAKTITLPKTNTLKSCIFILRMLTTLISGSPDGFGSFTNKTLNPYNFCMLNSKQACFGALETRFN